MKPTDIVVGKRYTNSFHSPSDVWLGCGLRTLYTDDVFTKKCLVLIESDASENIGRMFQPPVRCHDGMWEAFQEAGTGSSIWILQTKAL